MRKVQKNEEEIIVKNTWILGPLYLYQERKTTDDSLLKKGTQ